MRFEGWISTWKMYSERMSHSYPASNKLYRTVLGDYTGWIHYGITPCCPFWQCFLPTDCWDLAQSSDTSHRFCLNLHFASGWDSGLTFDFVSISYLYFYLTVESGFRGVCSWLFYFSDPCYLWNCAVTCRYQAVSAR